MIRKKIDAKGMELTERVVAINRVSKVVKGGKRFKFSVLVVVGDGDRYVGVGMGKAKEISEAVRKGIDKAGKSLVELKRIGNTIPHPVNGVFGAASVLLKPAVPGTGVIAGGVVRAIMELGGVKDVVAKVIGERPTHQRSLGDRPGSEEIDPTRFSGSGARKALKPLLSRRHSHGKASYHLEEELHRQARGPEADSPCPWPHQTQPDSRTRRHPPDPRHGQQGQPPGGMCCRGELGGTLHELA
jgi:small subunit ribosomal protein S5